MAVLLRTGLLFVLFSLLAFESLGTTYVHNTRLIYQLAAEQVTMFYRDVWVYRYIDASLLAVGFLFHRVTMLILTKGVVILGVLFLPPSVRRYIDDALVFPNRMMRRLHRSLHTRFTSRFRVEMVSWLWGLTYGFGLFVLVWGTIQLAALFLEGVLALPTIVLQHKIQLLASILSFAVGTIVRILARAVWKQLEPYAPEELLEWIDHIKVWTFRKAVRVREKVADRIVHEEEEKPYNHP